MHTSLKDLLIGERAKISVNDSSDISPKYIELGLTPGAVIEIKTKAPFGGPISVKLVKNNVLLALRKQEAQSILIEKL